MRCTHCGANIPDDQLICPVCGAEVQIVPDYNPLEDVLAREVKGSVAGATRQIQADVVRRQNVSQNQQNRNRQNRKFYLSARRDKLERVNALFVINSLDFENYRTCTIRAASNHFIFVLHPAFHDRTALQTCIDVS